MQTVFKKNQSYCIQFQKLVGLFITGIPSHFHFDSFFEQRRIDLRSQCTFRLFLLEQSLANGSLVVVFVFRCIDAVSLRCLVEFLWIDEQFLAGWRHREGILGGVDLASARPVDSFLFVEPFAREPSRRGEEGVRLLFASPRRLMKSTGLSRCVTGERPPLLMPMMTSTSRMSNQTREVRRRRRRRRRWRSLMDRRCDCAGSAAPTARHTVSSCRRPVTTKQSSVWLRRRSQPTRPFWLICFFFVRDEEGGGWHRQRRSSSIIDL